MGFNGDLAQQQFCEAHVRFGSKADIAAHSCDVRFTPKSGHRSVAAPSLLHAKLGATRITNGSTSESARNVRSSLSCPNASRDR